jgi:hypothetical protein
MANEEPRARQLGPIEGLRLEEVFAFDEGWYPGGRFHVKCPVCGESYVHALRPTTIAGSEPRERVGDAVGTDYEAAHDARWVRSASDILPFRCESGHRFALQFGFHKGWTYFRVILAPSEEWDAVIARDYGGLAEWRSDPSFGESPRDNDLAGAVPAERMRER